MHLSSGTSTRARAQEGVPGKVAQDFGCRDGSGVLQVVKRQEQSARKAAALARKLDRIPDS